MHLMFLSVVVLLCSLGHCHETAPEQDLATAAQVHTAHGDGILKVKSAERTHSANEENSVRENFLHFLSHPDRHQETAAPRIQDLIEELKQENSFTRTPPLRPAEGLEKKIPGVSTGNINLENGVDSSPSVIDNHSISVRGNASVNVNNNPSVRVSGISKVSDSYRSFVSNSGEPFGSNTHHFSASYINEVTGEILKATNKVMNKSDFTIDGKVRQPVHLGECHCLRCNKDEELYHRGDFENVAFNKRVSGSSTNNQRTEQCNAVDGFDYASLPSCAMSSDLDRFPWMEIDLGSVFTIPSMSLFRRDSKEPDYFDQRRMLSVIILVDDLVCDMFKSYYDIKYADRFPVEIKATCKQPRTGRYVLIRKLIPHYLPRVYHYVLVCEVVIWVCRKGTYGSYETGCKPCPANCAYPCDNYYGCFNVRYTVSLKKPADKSHPSLGTAADVNDGQRPRFDYFGCLIMANTDSSLLWWRVDLIHLFRIYAFNIMTHTDYKMGDFSLMVTKTRKVFKHLESECYFENGFINAGYSKTYTCTRSLIGRYAVVVKEGPGTLALCAVDAYGHRLYALPLEYACNASSEYTICENGTACRDGQCKLQHGMNPKKWWIGYFFQLIYDLVDRNRYLGFSSEVNV